MKPSLVIMAAGLGSRYGGLKQIDPVGPSGELIIDYSIYDAIKAGFGRIIFIIKKETDALFREKIGDRIARAVPVEYIYQRLDDMPDGIMPPPERKKPWGTAHAVYCCRKLLDESFAVINADDFYGVDAFEKVCEFLLQANGRDKYHCCMPGYRIENTITEHGHVARGICRVSDSGYLTDITERTHIVHQGGGIAYRKDDNSFVPIPLGTVVSMNMWGFPAGIMRELEPSFRRFLSNESDNLSDAEFFLPTFINELLMLGKADVKVLGTSAKWYGVTYREDKESVKNAIAAMINAGKYCR